MKKAVVQYRFNELIRLPEDESGSVPYFLADYLLHNIENAEIKSVHTYKDSGNHSCDLSESNATFIDVVLPLDDHLIEDPVANEREITIAVTQMLKTCSFIVNEQVQCINERFFVIRPFEEEGYSFT